MVNSSDLKVLPGSSQFVKILLMICWIQDPIIKPFQETLSVSGLLMVMIEKIIIPFIKTCHR
jgi:hypothetical protein